MKRIIEPNIGDIVYITKGNALIPIKILDGSFFRNGRVSNFWEWLNLVSGEVEDGYGLFWEKGEYGQQMKECKNCGFSNEYGYCECSSYEKWYACPIENKNPENIKALEEWGKQESEGKE